MKSGERSGGMGSCLYPIFLFQFSLFVIQGPIHGCFGVDAGCVKQGGRAVPGSHEEADFRAAQDDPFRAAADRDSVWRALSTLAFGGVTAVDKVSFSVQEGELMALLERGEVEAINLMEPHVTRMLLSGKYRVLIDFDSELLRIFGAQPLKTGVAVLKETADKQPERRTLAVIAADRRQAHVVMRCIKALLEVPMLRRMVTAEDVAQTALFLCSAAGRNISGQPISVCGNVETL